MLQLRSYYSDPSVMRPALLLLILVGHLLAIAFGRCQTVWHGDLALGAIDAAFAESTHDHDHPHHPTISFGFGSTDHDHPRETPDHSHVPVPHSVTKMSRVQLVLPEAIAPFDYVELRRIFLPSVEQPRIRRIATSSEPTVCTIPLSGSTTHLLF
jgi:hypothetical protein